MISYKIFCDRCGKSIHQNTSDAIDSKLFDRLEKLHEEIDNGEEELCIDCWEIWSSYRVKEDLFQTEKD